MMLHRALDAVMPKFREIFRDVGLTEQQWRILRVLWEREELPAGELAQVTLIPPPSLVGIVDRLERRRLVARRRADGDRRGVLVRITPRGTEMRDLVAPRVDAVYRQIRNAIDPEVWTQLQQGLDCVCRIDEPAEERRAAINE